MTDKQKTTWIIVGCVLAVLLVAFLVWRMLKKDKDTETTTTKRTTVTLERGSRGDEVLALQKALNIELAKMSTDEIHYSPIAEDGIFGEETAMACNIVFGKEYVTM